MGSVVTRYRYDLPDGESIEIEADSVTGNPSEPEPVQYRHRETIEEEAFRLSDGIRQVLPKLPLQTRLLLDHASNSLGTAPIRVLHEAVQRFERFTLPKRLGW